MEGLLEIISNVWSQGLLGIGVTEIIVSALIFIGGAIVRAFFVGRVMARLEKLTSDTESQVDDVLLESLRKPLGYIPLTIAIYLIAVYLPLSGIAELFATNLIKAMIAFTIFTALANSVTPIFQAFTSSTVLTESMTKWLERAARNVEAGKPVTPKKLSNGPNTAVLHAVLANPDSIAQDDWKAVVQHYDSCSKQTLSLLLAAVPVAATLVAGLILWFSITSTFGDFYRMLSSSIQQLGF